MFHIVTYNIGCFKFLPYSLHLAHGKSSGLVITYCCLFHLLSLLQVQRYFNDTLFITLDLQRQTDT